MLSGTSLRADIREILILTSCVVLFAGCGSNISNSSPTPTPISTPTFGSTSIPIHNTSPTASPIPTPTPTPTPVLSRGTVVNQDGTTTPNKGNVSFNVAGLTIFSSEGIQCPLGAPTIIKKINPTSVSDHLVLATTRLTYSQEEIQLMTEYLHSIFTSGSVASSFVTGPPATLRWVPGDQGCKGAFQITNNGNTPVQISTVGMRITQAPQQNVYQYRTLDACTLLTGSDLDGTPCTFGASGAGSCSIYYATIHLQVAEANTVFTDTPIAYGEGVTCPELTINPNATTDLYITFLPSDVPNNFIYSVLPELTVSDANGTRLISLPQLASTITFANTGQISCYGLQGNAFVLEQPRTDPNTPPQYCM